MLHMAVLLSSVKFRAISIVNACVAGGNIVGPGMDNVGMSGNDTFAAVMIGIHG